MLSQLSMEPDEPYVMILNIKIPSKHGQSLWPYWAIGIHKKTLDEQGFANTTYTCITLTYIWYLFIYFLMHKIHYTS